MTRLVHQLRAEEELRLVDPELITQEFDVLQRIPATAQQRRRAKKKKLDERIKIEVASLLREHGVRSDGRKLDTQFRGRRNFEVVKSEIDKRVDAHVGREVGERGVFSLAELERAEEYLPSIVRSVESELFNASS